MAGEDRPYVLWVKHQPCLLAGSGGCDGPVHAHHAGERGLGQKAGDDTCVPLCMLHHKIFHDGGPPFSGASKEFRACWIRLAIAYTRLRWESGRPRAALLDGMF